MKIKKYKFDNAIDFGNKVRDKIITYPYIRYWHSSTDIINMFKKLKTFDVNNRKHNESYKLRNVNIPSSELLYKGEPMLLLTKESDYYDWNRLSDMFQESCRVRCKLIGQKYSSRSFFYKYPEKVAEYCLRKYGNITPYNIRESLWKLVKECTSHRPSNMIAMIQLFNAKSVLDFSSGWGDRLIGAMASDVDMYCGVDPNTCLVPNYQQMIKFFGKSTKQYVMINSPIEIAKLPQIDFDLVYTSPPYFNFETYSKEITQSTEYRSEQLWFNKFLVVAIDKVWRCLREGGHLAININQKNKHEKYIKWMLDYVKTFNNSVYLGVISYADQKISNPQPIWIWEKVYILETNILKLRTFRYTDFDQMYKIMSSEENMKNVANGKTFNFEQTKKKIKQYIKLKYTMYPIILNENTIIGYVGYYDGKYLGNSFRNKNFIRLVIDKDYRRKGYAYDIMNGFKNYMINNNIHNVYSMVLKTNIPSITLHKKLGLNISENIIFHNKSYVIFNVS